MSVTKLEKTAFWTASKVETYYQGGRYKEIADECLGSKDLHQFRCETAYVSLIIQNLMTGRNEMLKKTIAGYDQPKQSESLDKMLAVFEGLMKWEKNHE